MQTNIVVKLRSLAKGVSQSTLSLSFNLAGLLAGAILASSSDIMEAVPWALLLYPGMLSLRGSLGGMYAARLSTGLHVGTVEARFSGNTEEAEMLSQSITVLSLISALLMSSIASMFGLLIWGISSSDVLQIFLVSIAAMAGSMILMSPLTLCVSILSFRRGLDPDVTVYPIVSTAADIVVTLTYMLLLKVISIPIGFVLLCLLSTAFVLFSVVTAARNYHNTGFAQTLREFTLTLMLVSVIVNITGSLLESIAHKIGQRPELYIVYPAVIDTIGDVGSIVGSTVSTKLALEMVDPAISDILRHANEILHAWFGSLILFISYSVLPSLLFGLNNSLSLTYQLLATNLLSVPVIVILSMSIGFWTARKGWNPDNFIIPLESALSDSLTTLAVLLAVVLIP